MTTLKPETVGFVRGGMLFLEPPDRWLTWQRDVWTCCGGRARQHTPFCVLRWRHCRRCTCGAGATALTDG